MESNTFFDKIGGRKFVMSIICLVAGILIELYGKNGLSANMVALIGAIYATFTGANAFITNKAISKEGSQDSTAPDAAPINLEPINKLLSDNNQQLAGILNQVGAELSKGQEQQLIIQNSLLQIQKSLGSILINIQK